MTDIDPRAGDSGEFGPRPRSLRDRLLSEAPSSLTTHDLLCAVSGARGETSRRLAERALRRHGLPGLAGLPAGRLRKETGSAEVAAARLVAAFELGRRAFADPRLGRPEVDKPSAAYRHVRHLGTAKKEHLIGLYLDAQNGLIHRETISIGSLNTTRTHPREVLHPAVVHLALGFILAHNHPSGCLDPSAEDIEFTQAIARAGELMGIELYDHLIVAGDRFVSLRERGVL